MLRPILLLEACRQAALATAHRHFAVPTSHKFIITAHEIHLTHPQMITLGANPCELVLDSQITDRQEREGVVTGLEHVIQLSVAGTSIGHAKIGMRHKSPDSYQRLRLRNRDGAPLPSTADLPAPPPNNLVEPHAVGRTNPHNVVLTNLVDNGHTVGAEMVVPAGHASMFDHPQDHVPGMVLIEAARQLAVHALAERFQLSPAKILLTDLSATFMCFGELEPTTRLEAVVEPRQQPPTPIVIPAHGPTSDPVATDSLPASGGTGVDIGITQGSTSICLVRATLHTVHRQAEDAV